MATRDILLVAQGRGQGKLGMNVKQLKEAPTMSLEEKVTLEEKVIQHMRLLPEAMQAEVLDFIEYLEVKNANKLDTDWSSLSLQQAIRGMENEASPYSVADLKEQF